MQILQGTSSLTLWVFFYKSVYSQIVLTRIVTILVRKITKPIGIVTILAGIITKPIGIVTILAGIITKPIRIVSIPAGVRTKPIGTVSIMVTSIA